MQVHLEPIRGAVEDDADLNALYAEDGWQYWGMFRSNYYVYAATAPRGPAHTDAEAYAYALQKFFRQRVIGGVVLVLINLFFLTLYREGLPWRYSAFFIRYFPVEALTDSATLPCLLSLIGLFLIDLSYLLGLVQLVRYRRAVQDGRKARPCKGLGWLLVAGILIMTPVFIHTAQLFTGLSYRPYDLEGSGFVTLKDIEGEDLTMHSDAFYSMDYISHGGTLLYPEYWKYHQYARVEGDNPYDAPRLETRVVRYPLTILAKLRAEEMARVRYGTSNDYEAMTPAYGLDEVYYAKWEGWTHDDGRVFLPGGVFILREGSTVLFANYHGEKDLTDHLEAFAAMMAGL